ncbi:DoxX family protein [Staphylococcus nepalensis]|uniref:DoxX family protein n=1 Tax=Staphylococcus nepalensis TaxID=214473 RepID=UPI00230149BA|nr:DoxX family protein [Staphylococcus nepalensis]
MGIIMIILQIILGIFFIMTGSKILSGAMKKDFTRLGYPPIFNQITGIFEFVGGLGMLIGVLYNVIALLSSVLLGVTMFVGALSLIFLGKDPIKKAIPAIILFLLNFGVFIYYI